MQHFDMCILSLQIMIRATLLRHVASLTSFPVSLAGVLPESPKLGWDSGAWALFLVSIGSYRIGLRHKKHRHGNQPWRRHKAPGETRMTTCPNICPTMQHASNSLSCALAKLAIGGILGILPAAVFILATHTLGESFCLTHVSYIAALALFFLLCF